MVEYNTVPPHLEPTDEQRVIMDMLTDEGIDWVLECTGGNCSALVVSDPMSMRQVVTTNFDDVRTVFVLDGVDGGDDCALFATNVEVWATTVYESDDIMDYINIARFFTDEDSDPYEHVLSDGTHVADLFQ